VAHTTAETETRLANFNDSVFDNSAPGGKKIQSGKKGNKENLASMIKW
jgi:hypothetical protein